MYKQQNNERRKPMYSNNINNDVALKLVLNYISVEELLTSAMNYFAEQTDVRSKDNADVIFKAIDTFLK